MTHDQECTFDPKYCRDCKLQAEARADERNMAAWRVANIAGNVDRFTIGRAISAVRGVKNVT